MFTVRLYWILSIFITLLGIILLTWFRLSQATKRWVEEATLSFNEAGRLAYDFAIDGNTIIISTYSRIPTTTRYRIYIYTYDGKTWRQQAELPIPEHEPLQGYSLSYQIAIDGNTALVENHVFTRLGETWSKETQLQPPTQEYLGLGRSVAVDGDTAVIGTEKATHVFRRNPDTGNWFFEAEIRRSRILGYRSSPGRVAIDGDTIVDGNRVFRRSSTGTWFEFASLTLNGQDIPKIASVAISSNTIVLGPLTTSCGTSNRGAAYVFERNPSTGVWSYEAKLVPDDVPDFFLITYGFGYRVAIDGNTIIVGHGVSITNHISHTLSLHPKGRAYIFVRDSKTGRWLLQAKPKPRDYKRVASGFGTLVSIAGNRVIVSSGEYEKSTYVFTHD